MKVANVISQIEHLLGRQPQEYIIQLINDALLDISAKAQHYSVISKTDLVSYQRWYDLDDAVIDVFRVEVLDTNSRYVMIPKLVDPHKLKKEDSDLGSGSLT